MKVLMVCGTRPELIRLSETIKKLDMYTDHILVFTAQSYDYEMSQIFFDELGIRKPNYTLNVKADSLGKQVANILSQCEEVMIKEKPDTVLVLGDTNSALSCYIAKRMGIRVIHMEAGNRCWSSKVPEEVNRRIIDHTADVNLCYTEHARRNLLREGLHPSGIFVIGSPLPEVYKVHKDNIESSKILEQLELEQGKYFLASIHRDENVNEEKVLRSIMDSFNCLAIKYGIPVVLSTHPRTRNKISEFNIKLDSGVRLCKPFGLFDFIKLQKGAYCNLSDSGTINEDSAILHIPAVNVREVNERPEVYDTGNIVMSGIETQSIIESVSLVTAQKIVREYPLEYKSTEFSIKAIRLIIGHHQYG